MSSDFSLMQTSGRITKDPIEFNVGSTKKTVFSIAVNRNIKKDDGYIKKTTFVDCVAWGNTADHVIKYAKKGNKVVATGDWETDTYEGKDGKVSRHQLVVRNINIFSQNTATEEVVDDKQDVVF